MDLHTTKWATFMALTIPDMWKMYQCGKLPYSITRPISMLVIKAETITGKRINAMKGLSSWCSQKPFRALLRWRSYLADANYNCIVAIDNNICKIERFNNRFCNRIQSRSCQETSQWIRVEVWTTKIVEILRRSKVVNESQIRGQCRHKLNSTWCNVHVNGGKHCLQRLTDVASAVCRQRATDD